MAKIAFIVFATCAAISHGVKLHDSPMKDMPQTATASAFKQSLTSVALSEAGVAAFKAIASSEAAMGMMQREATSMTQKANTARSAYGVAKMRMEKLYKKSDVPQSHIVMAIKQSLSVINDMKANAEADLNQTVDRVVATWPAESKRLLKPAVDEWYGNVVRMLRRVPNFDEVVQEEITLGEFCEEMKNLREQAAKESEDEDGLTNKLFDSLDFIYDGSTPLTAGKPAAEQAVNTFLLAWNTVFQMYQYNIGQVVEMAAMAIDKKVGCTVDGGVDHQDGEAGHQVDIKNDPRYAGQF